MRQLLTALCLLASISFTVAEDPPIVVIRVASLADLENDRLALEEIGGSLARRADPVQELFRVADIPRGPWLDEERPLWAIMTQSRLMAASEDRFVGLLPVLDLDTALRAMGEAQGEADDDGIVTYLRGDDVTLYVRADRDYMTVGASREGVKQVDRSLLEAMRIPPGTFAIDVDLEPLTPMAEMAFAGQRQAMQRQMDQARKQMEQAGNPTDELDASRTTALESVTFGHDMLLGLMRNVSHAQLAVERQQAEVLFHLHLLPLASSDLESIIEAQPNDFPRLARAIPEVDTSIKGVTNIEYTEELQETLSFLNGFYDVIGRWTGLVGGDMDWLPQMFDDQMDFSKDRMRCMRGDGAFVTDFGSRSITVYGTKRGTGCDEIHRRKLEKLRNMMGPGDEPLMQVTEPAMIYQGANVARTELRTELLEQLVGGEEQESLRAMLDQLGVATSSLHAEVDGVAVTVAGDTSDEDFKSTVDRLSARTKKGGLSPEEFLPFEAGGGMYVSLDMPPGGFAAVLGGKSQATTDDGNRMVFAARAIDGRLAVSAAMPLSMFDGLTEQDQAEVEAGVPADFWPPLEEAETGTYKVPAVPDDDGVTHPVLIDRADPEYPEWMQVSSLEGRVILKAIVRKNGTPHDVEMLNCAGRGKTDPERRGNLSRESDFCQVMYAAAAEAVEQWRYEPATKDGEAVDAPLTVIIVFSLN